MATSETTSNHITFNNSKAVETLLGYRDQLLRFMLTHINNANDAEDLVQDVFLRLLEYPGEILPGKVKSLAFAIASNVANDYLRHLYVKTSVHTQMADSRTEITNETENEIIGHDMERLERRSLENMPSQRRLIYMMRIHEGKTTPEIAEELNISPRTAENHFYIGIRQMRACFAAAI